MEEKHTESAIEKAKRIIESYQGPKIRIMEVCGTHTHEIFKLGLRNILPENIELISGPGCPVCVTPVGFIDEASMLALSCQATICTFGDLVRVPGTDGSLAKVREQGGKIQVVYSPLDAVEYAEKHPMEQVVFLSVGFETTTPASVIAVSMAEQKGLTNFSLLTANKTMPKAYEALKDSVDVYLYPGHVNAITGTGLCEKLAESGISGVVTGFTAGEIMSAFAVIIRNMEKGKPFFVNCYPRVVTREGSIPAQKLVEKYMEACDSEWRGLGIIPDSGMQLREAYQRFDARKKFQLPKITGRGNPACRCGEVLQGKCKPRDCKVFGRGCTPQHPIGACMVSSEGACAAYYQYSAE